MVLPRLTDDEDFRTTNFVLIDFETTTPTGRRPEPIELAVLTLRLHGHKLRETDRLTALIRPPEHAPLTPFDTEQTGITTAMLAAQPDAATVLADLDARFDDPPYLLVAHNAPTEAGVLYDYRTACQQLAVTNFLDTVRLARTAYPQLPSHGLDSLIHHLRLPRPTGRHRAMPDVELTAEVFRRLIDHGATAGHWRTLRQLRADGGYQAKAGRPGQQALF